jgi:hypothetical protein
LFFFFFYYNKNPSTEEKTLARNDDPKMTQKSNQFKGQQKRKTIAPNRHGKSIQTRKGKRNVKPTKMTKEMDTDRVISIFFNLPKF